MKASDDLCQAVGDAPEMVRQARILAQATSELVGNIKSQAEEQQDNEQQKKLPRQTRKGQTRKLSPLLVRSPLHHPFAAKRAISC